MGIGIEERGRVKEPCVKVRWLRRLVDVESVVLKVYVALEVPSFLLPRPCDLHDSNRQGLAQMIVAFVEQTQDRDFGLLFRNVYLMQEDLDMEGSVIELQFLEASRRKMRNHRV